MDTIPQPVLYTVIVALSGAIIFLFKIVIGHHADAATEWRIERAKYMERLHGIEMAINRTAQIEIMHLVVAPNVSQEIKASAKAMLDEITPRK